MPTLSGGLLVLSLLVQVPAAGADPARAGATAEELIARAYDAVFNLDHAEAIALARQAVKVQPEMASAHRALASILWIEILFQRGAVTVDHFMGSLIKSKDSLPEVASVIRDEFTRSLERAIELAEQRLDRVPDDLEAQYDAGAAYALQASYQASIEGSVTAAFGSARRAYNAQERVLERQPDRPGANVIVGTYRYVVSALGLPSRVFAYLAGFGGGKERGIAMVESAVNHSDGQIDALSALLLIYTREERHEDALRAARRMAEAYPRNRLFVLEAASAAIRADRADEAERLLTGGLASLAEDSRRKAPGELAVWYYKRAMARIKLGRVGPAREDLAEALRHQPVEWIRGRIQLEFGKAADLEGRRPEAVAAYGQARDIARRNQDPIGVRQAAALLATPYRGKTPRWPDEPRGGRNP